MHSQSTQPNTSYRQKPKDLEKGRAELLAALLQTREIGRTIGATVLAMLESWAKGNRFKRFIAKIFSWLAKLVFASAYQGKAPLIRDVLKEPHHARLAVASLPALGNGIVQVGQAIHDGSTGENKPSKSASAPGSIDMAGIGKLFTDILRETNKSAETNTSLLVERRTAFVELIRNVDFGELKETTDRLAKDAVDLSEMINEEMWRYPAKMLCLLAVIPTGINAGIAGLTKTLEPINRLAPDLLADVLIELLRDVDGKAVGKLANEVLELLRKIETGQVLIGDQGKPQLPEDVGDLVEDMLEALDIELVLKLRGMLSETKESLEIRLFAYLENHPELVREMIAAPCLKQAAKFRQKTCRLDTIENTLDDDEITEAVQRGIAALDAQEIAETANRSLSLFDRIHDEHPGIARELIAQTVQALDANEIEQAAAELSEDAAAALKAIAPKILPPLIRAMVELLDTPDDGQSQEIVKALNELRRTLSSREEVA